jgi:hypothetical protein
MTFLDRSQAYRAPMPLALEQEELAYEEGFLRGFGIAQQSRGFAPGMDDIFGGPQTGALNPDTIAALQTAEMALLIELIAFSMLMSERQQAPRFGGLEGLLARLLLGSFSSPGAWGSARSRSRDTWDDCGCSPTTGSGSSSALDLARSLKGASVCELRGSGPLSDVLDNCGDNVSCANFVSACLEKTGQITRSQHSDSVAGLASNLERDPKWSRTSLQNAKPGDVVCLETGGKSMGHCVMFAGWRGDKPVFIGANGSGAQHVSECTMNYPVTAVYHYNG